MQQRISYSCALAIAGTIAATAGFAFVTGGAGLIVALINKRFSDSINYRLLHLMVKL